MSGATERTGKRPTRRPPHLPARHPGQPQDGHGRGGWGRVRATARTPFVLARFPGLLASVIGASVVLGIAASAGPLFLSSAGGAALAVQIARTSPSFGGLVATETSTLSSDRIAFRADLLDRAVGGFPGLAPPIFSAVTPTTTFHVSGKPSPAPQVQPVTRTGFERHIEIVAGGAGEGVWLPSQLAAQLRVRPGDLIEVAVGPSEVPIRVAGTYRDLHAGILDPFWTPLASHLCCTRSLDPLPSFLLMDEGTLVRLESSAPPDGELEWEYPLGAGTSLAEAKALEPALSRVDGWFSDPRSPLGSAFNQGSTGLPSVLAEVRSTTAVLTGPVSTLTWAATAVALIVMAMAGINAVRRRRAEFGLLRARGASAGGVALRSVAEALVPVAVGITAGWLGAIGLVRIVGPSEALEPSALRSAAAAAVLMGLAGLLVFGLVCGATVRTATRQMAPGRGRLRAAAARLPWEVAVLTLAAAALVEIQVRGASPFLSASGAASATASQPPEIDRMMLLFPILFLAGMSGLAVRAMRRFLPRFRIVRSARRPGLFLAARRLAASPRSATALIGASAAAFGVLIYGGVLAASVQGSARAKALTSVGSDMSVAVAADGAGAAAIPDSTMVIRVSAVDVGPGDAQADLLIVDPATLPSAVHWQSGFADRSLQDLLAALQRPSEAALPAIVVAGALPGKPALELSGVTVPIREVGSASVFPGLLPGRSMLVIDRAAFERALAAAGGTMVDLGGSASIWVKGDPDRSLAALRRTGISTAPLIGNGASLSPVLTAEGYERTASFLAVSWTLGLLQSVGILAGVLSLFGLLLYLQARQRDREIAFALAARMGLTRRDHLVSVVGEIVGMLGSAFVLGAVLALAAAAVVHGKIDLIPGLPGISRLVVPAAPFLVSGATVLLAAITGSLLVHRQAERANIAEVMRFAA